MCILICRHLAKKIAWLVCLSLSFVMAVPSSASADLRLKLSGGRGYLMMDGVNQILQDWRTYEKKDSDNLPNWTFIGEEGISFHDSLDLEGELLWFLTRNLALGLGGGWIHGKLSGEDNELRQAYDDGFGNVLVTFSYIRPNEARAVPLTLSAYLFFRITGRLSLFMRGGGGVLWAEVNDREGYRDVELDTYDYEWQQMASGWGRILHGGLGMAVEIERGLSLFIEGNVRQGGVRGLDGENFEKEKGTLYYFEEYHQHIDFWKSEHRVLSQPPDGENMRNIREAEIDLDGFSVRIGLIVRL